MSNPKTLAQLRNEGATKCATKNVFSSEMGGEFVPKGTVVDPDMFDAFNAGFDAGARAVMERAAELVKHINCDVELHARVGIEYCEPCKAIADWQLVFKGSNNEPG